jgi:ABC-2 type transport system ATP-binding protein
MATLPERFTELHAVGSNAALAEALEPVGQRSILGGRAFIFEDVERRKLAPLGELKTPTLADLFIAKVGGGDL